MHQVTVEYRCPSCRRLLAIGPILAGRLSLKCPRCGMVVTLMQRGAVRGEALDAPGRGA